MANTYTTPNTAAAANNVVMGDLNDNDEALRSMFSSTTAPTSPAPVDGQLFYNETTEVVQIRQNGAWINFLEMAHAGDADFAHNALVDALLESQAGDETPSGSNVGQVYLETGAGIAKVVLTSSLLGAIVAPVAGSDLIPKELGLGSWQDDVSNPPTAGTQGTTPTTRGKLFNATNELISRRVRVPAGFSGAHDLTLRVEGVLNTAPSASTTLDLTCNLVSITPGNGESCTKTSTAATGSYNVGTNNAAGDDVIVDITLDYNDATNPIAAGDYLTLELSMTNVTGVTDFIFTGAELLAPFGTKLTE